ncbi:MAG: cobalt-precorrin-5B (C(1))-methyltransferase CbiD [Oscillospiraceae bacterium]|nr:cobalt-precorrin-5B (C(1))-methyltransferase CbiD [Oscillospiraceae bacterium]
MFEHYIRSGAKLLRCGYTTGTCAALAAAGAAQLLLSGKAPESLQLLTPRGLTVEVTPESCALQGDSALCAVRKDAGDDPDVTDGLLICAEATRIPQGIRLEGGKGVGRVSRPGLDQPVGEAAINRVPRQMIRAAVEAVCAELAYPGGISVVISVPGGEAIAKKTFNPALGIEGGISILGTSGIVEPMSEQAIVDTIHLEIRQAAAAGFRRLILVPGNYGSDFLLQTFPGLNSLPRTRCSNFIGEALDMAALEGFRELLLVGHIGKLVKLAGGIMNTHSRTADCRRELFCAHAAVCGASQESCQKIMKQVTSDGCIAVLDDAGLRGSVMQSLLSGMQTALDRRAAGAFNVGAATFSNEYGFLGMTPTAEKLLQNWRVEL